VQWWTILKGLPKFQRVVVVVLLLLLLTNLHALALSHIQDYSTILECNRVPSVLLFEERREKADTCMFYKNKRENNESTKVSPPPPHTTTYIHKMTLNNLVCEMLIQIPNEPNQIRSGR
jgi:hypothetical protein